MAVPVTELAGPGASSLGDRFLALFMLYGIKILVAVAVLIIGRLVAKLLERLVGKLMSKAKQDETLVTFVSHLVYAVALTFVIIAALNTLGIPTASFVAVIGAAGLAIGLALQGSLANFAAGVLMIIFKPFRVGDFVEGGGTAGIVEKIEIFTTQLRSPDNKTIIVPNAKMTGDNIVNYAAKGTRRVDMCVGVSYGADVDKVKEVLRDVITKDARVLADPPVTIALSELGDSSVNFVVRPWVNVADYWNVLFAFQEAIKKRLDSEGIGIPYPQRDVHVYQHNA